MGGKDSEEMKKILMWTRSLAHGEETGGFSWYRDFNFSACISIVLSPSLSLPSMLFSVFGFPVPKLFSYQDEATCWDDVWFDNKTS